MINRLVSQIVITTAICFLPLHAENKLQDTRDVLDQWVETKQIISEERADWRLEQSILKDSQSLLDNELARLTQALADLEASATAADEDRTQLAAEKDLLKAASSVVEANIGGLETKMKALVTSLPQPLVDKIKPLMRRLPDDPNNTKLSLGERVQNIVGILSQADKFNTTITLSNETREIADGSVSDDAFMEVAPAKSPSESYTFPDILNRSCSESCANDAPDNKGSNISSTTVSSLIY